MSNTKAVRKVIKNTPERKVVSCSRPGSGKRTLLLLILAKSISENKIIYVELCLDLTNYVSPKLIISQPHVKALQILQH